VFKQHHQIKSGKAVIIYFWAVWCGPCKLLTPIFEKLAKQTAALTSEVEFYKVDVDEQDEVGLEADLKSVS
jgi:thioredoxin 1